MSALAIDAKTYAAPRRPRASVVSPDRGPRATQARPAAGLAGTRQALPARACTVRCPAPAVRGAAIDGGWELTRRGMAVAVIASSSTFVAGLVALVMAFLAIPA